MRTLIILLVLIFSSCKDEIKFNQIVNTRDLKESRRFNYFLPKKIIADKQYQYWQFKKSGYIVHEVGDTLLRKLVDQKFKSYQGYGVPSLGGGHPFGEEAYLVTVAKQKVSFINSDKEFRKFLGTIDNLEEALLFARTYGCIPNGIHKGTEYRKVGEDFELHLTRFDKRNRVEYVSFKITKNGNTKIESLGFCEKEDCSWE